MHISRRKETCSLVLPVKQKFPKKKKTLSDKLDAKFKEICEKEGNTAFSFNRDIGYANLKKDIINILLEEGE